MIWITKQKEELFCRDSDNCSASGFLPLFNTREATVRTTPPVIGKASALSLVFVSRFCLSTRLQNHMALSNFRPAIGKTNGRCQTDTDQLSKTPGQTWNQVDGPLGKVTVLEILQYNKKLALQPFGLLAADINSACSARKHKMTNSVGVQTGQVAH